MADAAKPSAPPPPIEVTAVPIATAVPVSPQSSPQHVHVHIESPRAQPTTQGWNTGICGCTDNCCNLWMVACCPCVTYGQVAERIGHNGCCQDCGCCCSAFLYVVCGGHCLLTCLLRRKVAAATGIRANCCDDFCMSVFCGPCVTCQMANQVEIQKDGCSFAPPPRMETMQR